MRPSGAGLENVHFLEYTFVLDIHCHFLEYTFVSDIHIANNWGKCVSWRVSVCHLAVEFGNVHFLESVSANYWGMLVIHNVLKASSLC